MKTILIITIGFVICGLAGYLAYLQKPAVRTYPSKGYSYVPETRITERMVPVKFDDKTIYITATDTYEVLKPVWETRVKEIELNNAPAEKLRYWILLAISVFFGGYNVIVLGFWSRDKFFRKRESKDTEDTSKRLNALLAFYMGTLTGFIAATDYSDPKIVEVPSDSFHLPTSMREDADAASPAGPVYESAPQAPPAPIADPSTSRQRKEEFGGQHAGFCFSNSENGSARLAHRVAPWRVFYPLPSPGGPQRKNGAELCFSR